MPKFNPKGRVRSRYFELTSEENINKREERDKLIEEFLNDEGNYDNFMLQKPDDSQEREDYKKELILKAQYWENKLFIYGEIFRRYQWSVEEDLVDDEKFNERIHKLQLQIKTIKKFLNGEDTSPLESINWVPSEWELLHDGSAMRRKCKSKKKLTKKNQILRYINHSDIERWEKEITKLKKRREESLKNTEILERLHRKGKTAKSEWEKIPYCQDVKIRNLFLSYSKVDLIRFLPQQKSLYMMCCLLSRKSWIPNPLLLVEVLSILNSQKESGNMQMKLVERSNLL